MSSEQEAQRFTGPVDAVILAGSVNRIELFPGNKPGRKALVELHGKPLIAYVLDALHASRDIANVVVVAHPEVIKYATQWPRVHGVPEGHSLVRNAYRGLLMASTPRVLFCNPDQPLLRPEMVDEFVDLALPVDGEVVTSWVRFETMGRYAEDEHKFAAFGDGKYAHGNLFLLKKDIPEIQNVRARMESLYAARKSNLRFAMALGPQLFARYLLAMAQGHLPTLEETLNIVGDHFGVRLAPVICSYPEIALDIDEPGDYALAEKFLGMDGAAAAA